MQVTETNNYTMENFLTTIKFSMPTLMEERIAHNFGDLCVLISRKIKIKRFSEEILDYQVSRARKKNNEVPIEYSFTSFGFLIEILIEEIGLVLADS